METLRQSGRPPRAIAKPSGVGPQGKGGRRKAVAAKRRARTAHPRSARPVGQPELLKQREELSRKFAELQWDLGGMAYEMASRDHYRLDVLNKQAAKLQEVDAELGQIERLLKLGHRRRRRHLPVLRRAAGARRRLLLAVRQRAAAGRASPSEKPKPKAATKT